MKIFDGTISSGIKQGVAKGGAFGVGWAVGSVAHGVTKAGIRTIGKSIVALTRDKEAVEAEKNWYNEATELIGASLGFQG